MSVLTGRHDLPPMWDGAKVEWSGWRADIQTSAIFHEEPEPCPFCGSFDRRAMSIGVVERPGESERIHRYMTPHPKTGRLRPAHGTVVPAWPVQRLVAFRCNTCRHDQVWDNLLDILWDLDDSDYGDSGSVAPREET